MNTIGAETTHPAGQAFVESVIRLEPRVAAFDCDGTLWSGDAGETFFRWEIERGVVSAEIARTIQARYVEYKAGTVSEEDMCGEMVSMHKGISEAVMMEAATEFMKSSFPGHVFSEMRQLVDRLHANGCEIWAVSSSNEWVIRVGMEEFGIHADRILATKTELANGIITERLVRVPSGAGKPKALKEAVGKDIDAAFGNSRWDLEMLSIAKHSFAVNPNPDLETAARERQWIVYFPNGTARK